MLSDVTIRKGRCHCGTVRFTAEVPRDFAMHRCNCSICAMKGVVMIDVPLAAVTVTAGKGALTLYRFNTGEAKHYFCSHCGIHCFHQTRSDPDKYAVNAACIEGLKPHEMPEMPVHNGANHPNDNAGRRTISGVLRYHPERAGPA